MEFPKCGVVSYDPPSEDLRDFMRRKFTVIARVFQGNKNGVFHGREIEKEMNQVAQELVPENDREEFFKDRTELWYFMVKCCKPGELVKESEVVQLWLDRVYSPPEKRKGYMQKFYVFLKQFFDVMDQNKDGFIDADDWAQGAVVVNEACVKRNFQLMDTNGDGLLSLDEYCYAKMNTFYASGPDSIFSYLYGTVPDSLE